jgi:amidase
MTIEFKEYDDFDALGLAELVRSNQVSPQMLMDAALSRIAAVNPACNAVVERCYALAARQIAAGLPAGPFTGVPFLLKNMYHYEGMPTSFGSRLFAGAAPPYTDVLIRRHLRAGLVILGKTNSPELGVSATTEPMLYGATRNPWNLERSPGGSSGGAAAAVAARMVPVAHASDGGGSLRNPASCCGLFGLKPTRGRNPMGEAGEGWAGMSIAHVISRSVRDSAAMLDATRGPDIGDPYTAPPPTRPHLAEIGVAPGRLRIGLMTHFPDSPAVEPDCIAAAEQAARLCETLGHDVETTAVPADPMELRALMRVIASTHLLRNLDRRAEALGRPVCPEEVEPNTWLAAQRARSFHPTAYIKAREGLHLASRRIAEFFAGWDILLTPTLAKPPQTLGLLNAATGNDDTAAQRVHEYNHFSPMYNVTGQPAASVPLYWTADGLPVGVQIAARINDEATIFRLASQLEAAQPWQHHRPSLCYGQP